MRDNFDELQPCEICGKQNWQGDKFFSEYFCFPLSVLFHQNSILILLTCCSYQRGKQTKQRTFVKAESFWKPVSFGYRRTFTLPGFQGTNLKMSSYSQFMTEMAACMSRVLSSRRKCGSLNAQNGLKIVTQYHFYVCISHVFQMTRLFLGTFTNTSRRPQIYSESFVVSQVKFTDKILKSGAILFFRRLAIFTVSQ